MYSLGIDLTRGAHTVAWARTPDVGAPTRIDASGTVPAVVGAAPDGTLRVSAGGREPERVASGFIERLGSSETIIVGATPYGAEALLAAVLDEVVRISTTELGDTPAVVGIVHDDDWDRFRCSLLVEAARVAGTPADRVVLVPREAAATAAGEVAAAEGTPAEAAGGSSVAAATLADEHSRRTGVPVAVGAALAGAVAASTIGTRVLGVGTATAAGAAAGPSGMPLSSGPAGAFAAGPVGTPLAGPTGQRLAGPTGQSLAGGPAGAPLTTAAKATTPRWKVATLAGGAAAVVTTVAVVVLASRGDGETAASPPTTPPSTVAAVATTPEVDSEASASSGAPPSAVAAPTEPMATDVSTTSTPASTLPVFDLATLAGDWDTVCEPFLPGDGASAARWSIDVTGGDTMDLVIQGVDYTTTDCSDPGIVRIEQPVALRVLGVAPVGGTAAVITLSDAYGVLAFAVSGDELSIAVGGDQAPTSFDPELSAVRG